VAKPNHSLKTSDGIDAHKPRNDRYVNTSGTAGLDKGDVHLGIEEHLGNLQEEEGGREGGREGEREGGREGER